MSNPSDDVSKIHKRYSLTLINPSSYYHSLIFSIIVSAIVAATVVYGYFQSDDILYPLVGVIGVLLVTQIIDTRYIKNKEYSKSLHTSLFGNILWLITLFVGLLSVAVFSKDAPPLFYIAEGMFIFASFRIGILTTVLGVSVTRAWLVCFIQPLAMFLVLMPQNLWIETLLDPMTLVYGIAFLIIATVWSVLTDRIGRPGVQSTHKLVQAYIASQGKDQSEMESIMEERSNPSKISTSQLRLSDKEHKNEFRLVIPDLHPGPYHPIGGSNIPNLIFKNMYSSAMVMHSVSDHSLNLPSQVQVENYLKGLTETSVSKEGLTCTEPVTVQINKARATGLLFEKNAILFLSLSPHGMEDLPSNIKSEIENYSKNRNFDKVMVVDCHNAMGEEISGPDSEDMLKAAKSCLDTLITKQSFPIEFGYSNSENMNLQAQDLANSGIGVLCLKINGKKYFLGWADANNMANGLREEVVNNFSKNDLNLLEICTSDTHFSPGNVRNKNGYYELGIVSKPDLVSKWFLNVAKIAEQSISPASYEILENESKVKVMGSKVFEDYSKTMDKSLNLTKYFLIGTVVLFVISML